MNVSRSNKLGILTDMLAIVEKKKQVCLEKRWKYRKEGKEIIICDQLDKVVAWVENFKAVGNAVVQYDPGHAALPWAGVLLVLQIFVNDSETFGAMMEGVEQVSFLITRCTILESLYLSSSCQSSGTRQLREAIIKLYVSILRYLAKARRYFDRGTAKRMLVASVKTPQMSVHTYLSIICKKQAHVDMSVDLIDAERWSESRDRAQHLEALLHQLEQPIERSAVQLSELHDRLQQSDRIALLNWLSRVPYRKIHQMTGNDVLPRSGEWILQNPEFVEWTKSSLSSTLFLHGVPGSGKTKLMYNVVNRHLSSRNTTPAMTAYFYCVRNPAEPKKSNPDEIMRSILKQFSSSRPELPIRAPVVQAFQERQRIAAIDGSEVTPLNVEECLGLILVLLDRNPAYIFLDALDECDVFQRDELINAINIISRKSSSLVKIMVTSRDDHDICCHFTHSPHIRVRAQDNEKDIERFVQISLTKAISEKRLLNGHVSQILRDKIATTLIERADGMFRWTSLQIQMLCDRQRIKIEEDVVEELGSLPRGLKESYEMIYLRIMGLAVPSRVLATRVFRWLMCAQSLLTANELIAAVSLGSPLSSYSVLNILDICCNLVVVDDVGVFKFAHLSVREYLETLVEYSPALNHSTALHRCLDIYFRLNDLLRPSDSLKDDYAMKSYASMYWPVHYQYLAQGNLLPDLQAKFNDFLFSANDKRAPYQDWLCDAWNLSLYSDTLEFAETQHECTDIYRHKLGSMANSSGSPLFLSCCFGWSKVLDGLAALAHTSLDCRNCKDESGLYLAAFWGHEQILKSLLSWYNISERGVDDLEEALYAGVKSEHIGIVQTLVNKQVSGLTQTRFGETTLQAAVGQNDTTILRLLLGLEVPVITDFSKVCCFAYEEGRSEALDMLLVKGASFEATQHYCLLQCLVRTEFDELPRLLMKQRLCTSLKDLPPTTGQVLEIEESATSAGPKKGFLKKYDRTESRLLRYLHAAASNGDTHFIDSLLDWITLNLWGGCFIGLHVAVCKNSKDVAILQLALGADIEAVDGFDDGKLTPLGLAISVQSWTMALFLIDHGANTEITIGEDQGLILSLVELKHDQDGGGRVLQALLSRGADPNLPITKGFTTQTPLTVAVCAGNHIAAQILLDHGANINGMTTSKRPALHEAASRKDSTMVRFLLAKGADPDVRGYDEELDEFGLDNAMCTALHVAAFRGSYSIAKQLLESSANVSAAYGKCWTALHLTVIGSREHMLPLLVAWGADVEAKTSDDDGQTALHIAAKYRRTPVTRRLIEMNANVNAKDVLGKTPLHHALENSPEVEVVLLLLAAGAHLDLPDKNGIAPNQIMFDKGLDEIKRSIDAYTCSPADQRGKEHQTLMMRPSKLEGILDGADDDAERVLALFDPEAHLSLVDNAEYADPEPSLVDNAEYTDPEPENGLVHEDHRSCKAPFNFDDRSKAELVRSANWSNRYCSHDSTMFTDHGVAVWTNVPSKIPIPLRPVGAKYTL